MDYDVSAVAGSLSQLCAALAGFSIVAINIVIDKDSIRDKLALPALIRITYLSFFGLIISAILHGIRSGEISLTNTTWQLTTWANFATVSAMLMLFYALFLLTAVNLSQSDNNHLFDRLFNMAALAMLFWQLGSMSGYWKERGYVDEFVVVALLAMALSLPIIFLPRSAWLDKHINDDYAFWYYLAVIFAPCVLFLSIWLYPQAIALEAELLLQITIMPALWGLILLLKHEHITAESSS
jgi:hypothetical protein